MATAAPEQDLERKLRELDERLRLAWDDYSASIRGLKGREYEEVEDDSWDHLQRTLKDLEGERSELIKVSSETTEASDH